MAGGDDQKQRLPEVMHSVRRQQRLIMIRGRHVIGKRQIGGGHHRDNAGGCAHCIKVQRSQRSGSGRAGAKGQVQRIPRRGDVIDIVGGPRHMQAGGVVGQGLGDTHARTSSTEVGAPRSSDHARNSMFCAASIR